MTTTDLTAKDQDTGEGLVCLQGPSPSCEGPVELRVALSGSGVPYPRCAGHWQARMARESEIRERYPYHPPADWSPMDAGEAWGDDDY